MNILIFLFSYLIGSIPAGYIAVKLLKGIDIRNFGSGTIGATNVKRILGIKWAFLILLFDAVKGAGAVLLSKLFTDSIWIITGSAICVILGNIFSIFLRFKAGKGVATTIGTLIVLAPLNLLIFLIVFFITVLITKYISLGSILGTISLAVSLIIMNKDLPLIIFGIVAMIIIIIMHRKNIERLLKGNEDKFRFKKI